MLVNVQIKPLIIIDNLLSNHWDVILNFLLISIVNLLATKKSYKLCGIITTAFQVIEQWKDGSGDCP